MRKLIALLILLPLAASAQAPEPTIRTTSSEVLLDFVVRDKSARILHDLRPDEIQVFEDGVPQKVRHFEFVDGRATRPSSPAPATTAAPTSTEANSPVASPTVNELREISVISIVIANLDPRGRKLTVDAMHKFLETELRPNTYIGVFSLGMAGLRFLQNYTNDREKISAAVESAANSALVGQLTAVNQIGKLSSGLGSADSSDSPFGYSPLGDSGGTGSAGSNSGSAAGGAASQAAANASGPAAAIDNFMATSWVSEMQDVYTDSMRYLSPLRTLAQAQTEIPGRKVILLFSAGLPVHTDTAELLRSVVSTANRANVTIYAVDTRGETEASFTNNSRRLLQQAANSSRRRQLAGVTGGDQTVRADEVIAGEIAENSIHADTHDNMANLAEDTGGALLPASLDMLDPLAKAMEEVRTHYELTYSPTNAATDGSFRKIEVKVARSGTHVFARNGYYALPVLNGSQIYPFEVATLKAINTKPTLHQFDFQSTVMQFRPGPVKTQLAFVFETPTHGLAIDKDAQWDKVHVCLTALIKDDRGQVVEKISRDIPYSVPSDKTAALQAGVVSFTTPFLLAPGHYTVDTAVVDRQSMKASVSRSVLDVIQDSGLSMSDVTVARRIDAVQGPGNAFDPLQARGGKVTPELSDSVSPDEAGTMKLYAVAYPPAPVDATVDARIEIRRDGKLLMRSPASPVPPDASGAASILASLPITKLPAGRYQAQVSFEYKGQRVAKTVAFTLTGTS